MSVTKTALNNLFPRLRKGKTLQAVISAASEGPSRARDFFREMVNESIPSRAVETLPAWYEMLGVPYDEDLPLARRQKQIHQAWVATGGLAIGSIENQIHIAFPSIFIDTIAEYFPTANMCGAGMAGKMQATNYPPWYLVDTSTGAYPVHFFLVRGEVLDIQELKRLEGFLDRVKPAHMEIVWEVNILSLDPTGQAGIGMAGLMEAGRV
jgi:uncharacterized protein YmfQ (DUF2313 family)